MPTENPHPAWTRESLLDVARAFQEARLLLTGAELDVFTLLAGEARPLGDLASWLDADPRALAIVLDALAAMGLLEKVGEAWQTAPSVRDLLVSDSPGSILPMILHSAHLWDRWGELTSLVARPPSDAAPEEARLRSFIGAMHVVGSPQAERIVSLVDPGSSRRLLDVGGASGTYALAFLAASAELRVTLFDRPPVVRLARERLHAAGVLDRVDLVPGDFYHDDLPGGHDLVFLSAIIHQNSPEENVALFRKAFAALDPGGRIVIRDHVLSPDRTTPRRGALFAVNMLAAQTGGNSYTFDEIREALTEAGFTRPRLLHPDTRMDGLVEAFRPH